MSQIDSSIPVLTDVIPSQALEEHVPPMPVQHAADDDERWQQIERNLREDVLRQILSRIDFVLEHRVRDCLADVLQTTVERVSNDLRSGLQHTLRDVVQRTISQEITRVKASAKKQGE